MITLTKSEIKTAAIMSCCAAIVPTIIENITTIAIYRFARYRENVTSNQALSIGAIKKLDVFSKISSIFLMFKRDSFEINPTKFLPKEALTSFSARKIGELLILDIIISTLVNTILIMIDNYYYYSKTPQGTFSKTSLSERSSQMIPLLNPPTMECTEVMQLLGPPVHTKTRITPALSCPVLFYQGPLLHSTIIPWYVRFPMMVAPNFLNVVLNRFLRKHPL